MRERREDIPLLAMHFLGKLASRSTPAVTEIDPEAMQAMFAHDWPGNVRELENAIRRPSPWPTARRSTAPTSRRRSPRLAGRPGRAAGAAEAELEIDRPLPEVAEAIIAHVERDYFSKLLARYGGNVARCARHSGLSRRCVTQKLQKYGLDRTRFKDGKPADAAPA